MTLIEIIFIGIGLSMDAFAVAICESLSNSKIMIKERMMISLGFGLFQCLMPLIGYFLGNTFEEIVSAIDHWISFLLLLIIGINMIKEAWKDEEISYHLSIINIIYLAIATSIDALAVGVTFSLLNTSIWLAVLIIGVITFMICVLGVKIGNVFGSRFKSTAEIFGGVILILMGLKILLEHLSVL